MYVELKQEYKPKVYLAHINPTIVKQILSHPQQIGFDFNETFPPLVKSPTIRFILTLALIFKWKLQQIDINNAFLNDTLQEEVYMEQPFRFISSNKSLVCRLNNVMYGLKQASRAWNEKLTQTFLHFGFSHNKWDHSFFCTKVKV